MLILIAYGVIPQGKPLALDTMLDILSNVELFWDTLLLSFGVSQHPHRSYKL